MRKLFFFLSVLFFVNISQAQKDEEMLKWLTEHIPNIDLEQSIGTNNRNKLKSVVFDKFGILAKGESSKTDYVGRRTFESATIENEFLILKDRMGDYYVNLKIADPAIRQRYKDIFTRYAYTFLNTGEEDFPIYEKDKVDKEAVVSEEPDGWKNFLLERFQIDAAYKHKLTPGEYKGELQFVVTQDGKIKDFKKIGNSPKGVYETMLWLMTGARKPWIPAKLNGKSVSSYVKIKVTFNVRELDLDDENDRMASMYYQKYKDVNLNIDDYENKNGGRRSVPPIVITEKPKTQVKTEIKKEEKEITKSEVEKPEKWITEPVAYFNSIGSFKEGLAAVYFENAAGYIKHGFINKKGKLVVPLKYESAGNFSHGLASVSQNDKYGFIDSTGKLVVPLIWDYTGTFSDNLAIVKKGEKYGYIDTKGKVVIPVTLNYAYDFHEEIARISNRQGKYGYMDKAGSIIIETKYENSGDFSEGLAKVKLDKLYAFIDKTGKPITDFIYEDANNFSNGIACVKADGAYGFINKKGEVVIPFKYDYAYPFKDGLSLVKLNRKWGMINTQGQVVIPFLYDDLTYFQEGLARIRVNEQYGFINKEGAVVIKPTFDKAGLCYSGLIATANNNRWLYIDKSASTAIQEFYDYATDFVGGLAEVEKNGKTFIIDRTGKKYTGPNK
jgi:WG containing repeat